MKEIRKTVVLEAAEQGMLQPTYRVRNAATSSILRYTCLASGEVSATAVPCGDRKSLIISILTRGSGLLLSAGERGGGRLVVDHSTTPSLVRLWKGWICGSRGLPRRWRCYRLTPTLFSPCHFPLRSGITSLSIKHMFPPSPWG